MRSLMQSHSRNVTDHDRGTRGSIAECLPQVSGSSLGTNLGVLAVTEQIKGKLTGAVRLTKS